MRRVTDEAEAKKFMDKIHSMCVDAGVTLQQHNMFEGVALCYNLPNGANQSYLLPFGNPGET